MRRYLHQRNLDQIQQRTEAESKEQLEQQHGTGPIDVVLVDWSYYYDKPVLFAYEVFGVELWDKQQEIANALTSHNRVTVRSGHKVGKSLLLAILALWWVLTREDSIVVLTSAGTRQVKTVLWREYRRLVNKKAKRTIPGNVHKDPGHGHEFDDGRLVVGFTTKEPEKAAGYSSPNLLYLIDEASGVPDEIFDAIEGNRAAENAAIVLFSNPTRNEGYFYRSFHVGKWYRVHISSEETPNVKAKANLFPGLAGISWVLERQEEWGVDSPLYQVRVLGCFPGQGSNSAISITAIIQAINRYKEHRFENIDANERLELGVDVARDGDDESVIYARRGRWLFPAVSYRGLDGDQLAARVLTTIDLHKVDGEQKPRVKIDFIGVGASPFDALKRTQQYQNGEFELIAVIVSESSNFPNKYENLRSEIVFGIAIWLKFAMIPEDLKLQQELQNQFYTIVGIGLLMIEPKKLIKKRIGRSPDRCDALALCIYEPVFVVDEESDSEVTIVDVGR